MISDHRQSSFITRRSLTWNPPPLPAPCLPIAPLLFLPYYVYSNCPLPSPPCQTNVLTAPTNLDGACMIDMARRDLCFRMMTTMVFEIHTNMIVTPVRHASTDLMTRGRTVLFDRSGSDHRYWEWEFVLAGVWGFWGFRSGVLGFLMVISRMLWLPGDHRVLGCYGYLGITEC